MIVTDEFKEKFEELCNMENQFVSALIALDALGTMPDGHCFCSKDRDPTKTDHQGECRNARSVLSNAGYEIGCPF